MVWVTVNIIVELILYRYKYMYVSKGCLMMKKLIWYDVYMKVCSAVQLCGFCLCLLGAARITHRAQGIVGIATRWNMVVTGTSAGLGGQCKSQAPAAADPNDSSEFSDSSDNFISVSPHDPSSFQTRQALGQYIYIFSI